MGTEENKNEAGLVCAARTGDKDALRGLIERNWGWLKGLVCSMTQAGGDADVAGSAQAAVTPIAPKNKKNSVNAMRGVICRFKTASPLTGIHRYLRALLCDSGNCS